jgi:phage portal protein BeeE
MTEDCLNRSLISAFGLSPETHRFKFDLSSVEALQDTEDSKVAREVSLVNAGVMTPNEVCTRHGLGAGSTNSSESVLRIGEIWGVDFLV